MFAAVYLIESAMGARSMAVTVLKKGAIYALLAVSMNLLNGFTGLFSLGQAGFMLVGAYTYAVLTIPMAASVWRSTSITRAAPSALLLPVVVGILAAGALAAILAALIGLPVLRLKSDYLAIATLGFAEIIRAIIPVGRTGPDHQRLQHLLKTYPYLLPRRFTPFLVRPRYVSRAIVLLINSTYGRAFKAIRDDEIAAEAMGINLFQHKQLAFVVILVLCGYRRRAAGNVPVVAAGERLQIQHDL